MATIPSGVAPSLTENSLTSLWDGLSPYLIASFFEVARNDKGVWGRVQGKTDPVMVKAPLIDANVEMTLNWQGAFEQSGAESKAPTMMAMLQSGEFQPAVDSLLPKSLSSSAKEFFSSVEGRTGITKLNSTQVFNGMPPVKISATALFRAWRDPVSEVEAPVDKLMEWLLPEELSKDGSVLARLAESIRGNMGMIDVAMPSKAPTYIGVRYKGRQWVPMVVESVGYPISSPVDKNGHYTEMAVPLTICSLMAIDRQDWKNTRITAL